jgi:hypothetical protein
MTNMNLLAQVSDVSLEDYCPFGLATCFVRDEGEIYQVKIVEPIPSAALGSLFVGELPTITADFPQDAQICDRFIERAIAATRTFKNRPEATKHIPVGAIKQDLNYSLNKKRVLNDSKLVRAEDNVKQHEYTHKVL